MRTESVKFCSFLTPSSLKFNILVRWMRSIQDYAILRLPAQLSTKKIETLVNSNDFAHSYCKEVFFESI